MLHDLLFVLGGTFGFVGILLVGAGFMAAHGGMYAFKSKEDGRSLAGKHSATRGLMERQKINEEARSHFGEVWKTSPARWLIFVGAGMFVGGVICERCLR